MTVHRYLAAALLACGALCLVERTAFAQVTPVFIEDFNSGTPGTNIGPGTKWGTVRRSPTSDVA